MGHKRQLEAGGQASYRRLVPADAIKIRLRREEYILRGMTDWKIANLIAEELGASPRSVESRIAYLVKKGELPANPNKQTKKKIDWSMLAELGDKLLEEGLCDGAIAKRLAEEEGGDGKRLASLKTTISALRKKGGLRHNPNNQVPLSTKEYKWVERRARELASIGLNKVSIARVLEHEAEKRNANAIRRAIWELERLGTLDIAERSGIASREMEKLILRRSKLIKAGWKDSTIAKRIAKETGRSVMTIKLMMHRIVNTGGCEENPKG